MNPKRARKKPAPERLIEVGVISGAHGLKGAMSIRSHTRPAIGIAGYSFWWLGKDAGSARPYAVERCWRHGRRILAKLRGVDSVEAADVLKGARIWVDAADIEVGEDEYLWQDLIGCTVVEESGRVLGRVRAMADYGAHDILIIVAPPQAEEAGEWMLPFTRDVVRRVDLEHRRIEVHLPEGMDACFTSRS